MKIAPSLLPLFGASIVLVILSWLVAKWNLSPWLSSTLSNAGIGVLTSIVIIYAYNQLLADREEMKRVERESKALSGVGPVLRGHYSVLLDCYRSACDSTTPPHHKDVNEFLGPHYQTVVAKLNIYAASPMNSFGTTPYYQYIEGSFAQLHQELTLLLQVAGQDLSHDVVLSVHRVRNSDLMRIARSLSELCNFQVPGFQHAPIQFLANMKKPIDDYRVAFAQLITTVERAHPQGLREYRDADWHNQHFAPGHARAA